MDITKTLLRPSAAVRPSIKYLRNANLRVDSALYKLALNFGGCDQFPRGLITTEGTSLAPCSFSLVHFCEFLQQQGAADR